MPCLLRSFALVFVAISVLAPATAPGPVDASVRPGVEDGATAAVPEVRLRKLHLVRPDLIPYPLAFEVVC